VGSKTDLRYHLILTTKYRRPALAGIEDQVYFAMREVEAASSFAIEAMGVEDGNHIHLAIKASSAYSIASLVNRIKGMSQHRLWLAAPAHLQRHYWGPSKKLWHGAYYCATTGRVSSDKILDYVREQNGPRDSSARLKTAPVSRADR